MVMDDAKENATFEKNSTQRKQRATHTKENICMGGARFLFQKKLLESYPILP
jgi:hypothetical protein